MVLGNKRGFQYSGYKPIFSALGWEIFVDVVE